MLDRFLSWLSALSEAGKSQAPKPTGMSRRGFLRALGLGATTVVMGQSVGWRAVSVAAAEEEEESAWSGIVNTTIQRYIREEEANILRNREFMLLLKKKGKVVFDVGRMEVEWTMPTIVQGES